MGSAALNLCWVGCGRLNGFYERAIKVYDYAAGALIAAEAGATVELPASNELDLTVCAPEPIYGELRRIVVDAATTQTATKGIRSDGIGPRIP